MTARPLAPEADLAHVLALARHHLEFGTMLDPEELLCELLGLDQAQLQDHLDGEPKPDATFTITYTRDADGMGPHNVKVSGERSPEPDQSPVARAREGWVRPVGQPGPAHLLQHERPVALCGHDGDGRSWIPAESEERSRRCPACTVAAEAHRRAREVWKVAEAGIIAHCLEHGRPLCGSVDPGPWRKVTGAHRCAGCVDISEVMARHG